MFYYSTDYYFYWHSLLFQAGMMKVRFVFNLFLIKFENNNCFIHNEWLLFAIIFSSSAQSLTTLFVWAAQLTLYLCKSISANLGYICVFITQTIELIMALKSENKNIYKLKTNTCALCLYGVLFKFRNTISCLYRNYFMNLWYRFSIYWIIWARNQSDVQPSG